MEKKNLPCLCVDRSNVIKLSILLKATNTFNVIPVKIPMIIFSALQMLEFIGKHKRIEELKQS